MIIGNPLFDENKMTKAASYIGDAKYVLLYRDKEDNNLAKENAGKNLREALWILSFVIDHVFDYCPYEHFMNNEDEQLFSDFKNYFLQNTASAIDSAIQSIKNDFDYVNNPGKRMFLKYRDIQMESYILDMFLTFKDNYNEFCTLINGPKRITDPSKPQSREIKDLIECILVILHVRKNYAPQNGDMNAMMQHVQIGKMYEMFLNPLLKALEVYKCGDHTDYWKEGDSMMDYMMFEINAKEIISKLIMILETQSPFFIFESNGKITNGLLRVYRDMIKRI